MGLDLEKAKNVIESGKALAGDRIWLYPYQSSADWGR